MEQFLLGGQRVTCLRRKVTQCQCCWTNSLQSGTQAKPLRQPHKHYVCLHRWTKRPSLPVVPSHPSSPRNFHFFFWKFSLQQRLHLKIGFFMQKAFCQYIFCDWQTSFSYDENAKCRRGQKKRLCRNLTNHFLGNSIKKISFTYVNKTLGFMWDIIGQCSRQGKLKCTWFSCNHREVCNMQIIGFLRSPSLLYFPRGYRRLWTMKNNNLQYFSWTTSIKKILKDFLYFIISQKNEFIKLVHLKGRSKHTEWANWK